MLLPNTIEKLAVNCYYIANMQTPKVYTVSEITRLIKGLIQQFDGIWLEGEISNFKNQSSGHMYFSLKDEKSVISAAFFKNANKNVKFKIEDGMKVIVHGSIDLYEPRGQYQIIVTSLEPKGLGALQIRFEQLKEKLKKEGLFDEARKRKLPELPQKIGIVTSPTGAAVQDMLNIIERRFPNIHVVLNPVKVQGEGAAEEVAQAINEMNADGSYDVLIVGRGGGSLEDLWAFNEEVVARAIFASKIPVVSAVGHEIDFTIADFVADLRAPTPSAAAELVVPNRTDLEQKIKAFEVRLGQDLRKKYEGYKEKLDWIRKSGLAMGLKRTLEIFKERLNGAAKSPAFLRPKEKVTRLKQEVDEQEDKLAKAIKHFIENRKNEVKVLNGKIEGLNPFTKEKLLQLKQDVASRENKLNSTIKHFILNRKNEVKVVAGKIESLNPLKILERGYSVTTKDGSIVKDAGKLQSGDEIETRFAKGSKKAIVR